MRPVLKAGTFSGYKLQGRIKYHGLDISIENERGSMRRGEGKDGHEWSTFMHIPYGYIRRTEGVDGDHVDCYIGTDRFSDKVFIIHQNDPVTGRYDEDKVMLGFSTAQDAKKAYLRQYDRPGFFGDMVEVDMDTFKQMLKQRYGMKLKKGRDNPGVQDGTGPYKGDGPRTGRRKGNCDVAGKLDKQGKSRNKTVKDFDAHELAMGIEIEMEHTDDRKVAQEIAEDHLMENSRYYTLYKEKMEEYEKAVPLRIHVLQKAKGKKMHSGETVTRKDGTYMKLSNGKFKKLSGKDVPKARKGKGVGTRVPTINQQGLRSKDKKYLRDVAIEIAEATFDSNAHSVQPYDNKKLMATVKKYEQEYGEEARGILLQNYAKRYNKLNGLLYSEGESFRESRRKGNLSKVKLTKSIVLDPITVKRIYDEL